MMLTVCVVLFYCYREEFRQTYKEKHPNNKSVSVVSGYTR